jgi:hypothetical protein
MANGSTATTMSSTTRPDLSPSIIIGQVFSKNPQSSCADCTDATVKDVTREILNVKQQLKTLEQQVRTGFTEQLRQTKILEAQLESLMECQDTISMQILK